MENLVIQLLFSLQDWVSQLVFSTSWNPEDVDSNASEEMNFLTWWEQTGKEQKIPCSISLDMLPTKGVVHIRSELKVYQTKLPV